MSEMRDGDGTYDANRADLTKTEYTCPMHPQIVRAEPGNCPICGMALEPRGVGPRKSRTPELAT